MHRRHAHRKSLPKWVLGAHRNLLLHIAPLQVMAAHRKSCFGKNTENQQLHVKFWFNRKKYGAVSYLFSCNKLIINNYNYLFLGRNNNKQQPNNNKTQMGLSNSKITTAAAMRKKVPLSSQNLVLKKLAKQLFEKPL